MLELRRFLIAGVSIRNGLFLRLLGGDLGMGGLIALALGLAPAATVGMS